MKFLVIFFILIATACDQKIIVSEVSDTNVDDVRFDILNKDLQSDSQQLDLDPKDLGRQDVTDVSEDPDLTVVECVSPCGPCGFDSLCVSSDGSSVCDGNTECGKGCASNAECGSQQDSVCYFGKCTTPLEAYIKKGSFFMGSPEEEVGRTSKEILHEVTLTHNFFVHRFPITQLDFKTIMGVNPSKYSDCGDNCPVESVSFFDAVAFANEKSKRFGLTECYDLSQCEGIIGTDFRCTTDFNNNFASFDLDCNGFRLPTESEWEYIVRSGTTSSFFFGEVASRQACDLPDLLDYSWFCANCDSTYANEAEFKDCSIAGRRPALPTNCRTTAVGQKRANSWGVSELLGSVSTLIWDQMGDYPETAVIDPIGPPRENAAIPVRGSGFCGHRDRLRSADRKETRVTKRAEDMGIRIIRNSP